MTELLKWVKLVYRAMIKGYIGQVGITGPVSLADLAIHPVLEGCALRSREAVRSRREDRRIRHRLPCRLRNVAGIDFPMDDVTPSCGRCGVAPAKPWARPLLSPPLRPPWLSLLEPVGDRPRRYMIIRTVFVVPLAIAVPAAVRLPRRVARAVACMIAAICRFHFSTGRLGARLSMKSLCMVQPVKSLTTLARRHPKPARRAARTREGGMAVTSALREAAQPRP